MTDPARTTTLGMVLTELGGETRLANGADDELDRPVTGGSVVTDLSLPTDAGVVLICPPLRTAGDLERLNARLSDGTSRLVILTAPSALPAAQVRAALAGHVVVETAAMVDPASVVLSIARSVDVPAETVTRRLASLQRSLNQVLGEPDPVVALLDRLKRMCNATVALVDKRGQAVHSTGAVPLALLFKEISHTTAETQMLDIEGWRGIANRVNDPARAGDHMGWLVAAARRDGFPDTYAASAVHVATALVEASQRMTTVAQQQERAIRAAALEEALALSRTPDDPDLAGRIASLGLGFAEELRAVVARPARSSRTGRSRAPVKELATGLVRALEAWGIAHLTSVRDKYVVLLVQASPATMKRVLIAAQDSMLPAHVGIGRRVQAIGEIADSYHDAQLAVRSLSRTTRGSSVMTYEDFDFATRLFSEVGTDRMITWARDFLAPLDDRLPLMEGLSIFFKHGQNMNAAAAALSIHHNSLRYRLAKVEELLEISLRDPAAVSSLFLALTALELERVQAGPRPRATSVDDNRRPSDVEAPHTQTELVKPRTNRLGVVLDPGH